jgi:hypothetical protein
MGMNPRRGVEEALFVGFRKGKRRRAAFKAAPGDNKGAYPGLRRRGCSRFPVRVKDGTHQIDADIN